MKNVHPHYGAHTCKQISRAKASRHSAAPATSETRRMTSVIHNQLTEITGLSLLGGGKNKDLQLSPRARKKMNQTGYETNWGKAEASKHIQTESFYLHPQSLQHNSVTFGRCLVYDRRRHSERIKRWNTDTLATGGLHLDISRWVRPLDLRCFPMERSQCLSVVPGLGPDQEVCLACCSHPGRNGILRLIVKMWLN